MSFLRIFGLICMAFVAATMSSWAQTAPEATPPVQLESAEVETPVAPAAQVNTPPPPANIAPAKIDFDDPAIIAAMEAREEAEEACLEVGKGEREI